MSEPERTFYRLKTDGGIVAAQGQAAGEAAIGVVLRAPDGSRVHELSVRIGWVQDHHVAEYRALVAGLRLALGHGVDQLRVFLDSALVVNQVNGVSTVRKHLKPLYEEAQALLREFPEYADIDISWVPRAQNIEADVLSNLALALTRERHRQSVAARARRSPRRPAG